MEPGPDPFEEVPSGPPRGGGGVPSGPVSDSESLREAIVLQAVKFLTDPRVKARRVCLSWRPRRAGSVKHFDGAAGLSRERAARTTWHFLGVTVLGSDGCRRRCSLDS
jgi:hypothetical protein